MLAFNSKLRRALEFEVRATHGASPADAPPSQGNSNVARFPPKQARPARRRATSRGLGIGVGLAAGLLVAFTLWLSRPPTSLAAEVVSHVEGEPDSWSRTRAVSAAELESVLRKSGVKLGPGMEPVVYANSCWFRSHYVPHFVIMTESGPVTVMILMHQQIDARQQFEADGFTELLVPARGGSIAILSRTPMALDKPASEVLHALEATNI
jgi:hypothetical protein